MKKFTYMNDKNKGWSNEKWVNIKFTKEALN